MMTYYIELGASPTDLPADLDARTDQLQEELEKLDCIIDPDLLVNLKTGEVIAAMEVEARDLLEATAIASSALRAAFHTIGDATPGWENLLDEFGTRAKPSGLVDA
jgi:hypothetical protein